MANLKINSKPTSTAPWREKAQVYVAYLGLYTLLAGDSWRYLLGWFGWGGIAAVIALSTFYFLFANRLNLRQLPPVFLALIGLMALSTSWSNYPALTALATFSQVATSAFGILLAVAFSWNELLKLLANTVRFILGLSLAFELYAAVVVQGPISPIYKNYTGETPPSGAFYWTQAHLLTGQRIQGIVGNSNILAFVSMLGLVLFAIEFFTGAARKLVVVPSIFVAAAMLALAKSAGIGFAIVAIIVVASVVWLVRGKAREDRHRLYRFAWTGAGIAAFFVLLYRTEVFTLIGKSPDMSGRAGIWQSVMGLIQLRPVQGWGWISYWVPGIAPFQDLAVVNGVPYYQAHNAYLDTWLQLGIFGLLLLLALIATSFVRLWRIAVRTNDLRLLWPVLIFVGLVVQNFTESRLLLESGWALLTLLVVKGHQTKIEEVA